MRAPLALGVLFFAIAVMCPAGARGDSTERGRLTELRAEIRTARGPMAYQALRKVWSEWDRGDPSEVEETLHDVSLDASTPPPVRAYAGLLEAYARRRRGDLDGSRARIARLGYVGNWIAVGPFENDGKVGLDAAYDPEKEQELPLNLTHDYDGKNHKPVRWRLLPPVSPYGWVDFGSFVRPTEQSCVYASTFVRDSRVKLHASRPVSVWVGAAGALRVFWNAVEIVRDDKYRDLDPERFAATATLREGWNRLTVKVCGDERPPMITLRVAGADGAPDEHLEVDADPRHSTSQGGAVQALGKGVPAPPSTVEGPAQAFERLAKGNDPGVLEAFARYLVATGSDDPSEHRARELARRAAEKAPTIDRLLLAGEVAESRNQRASWIDRAEALVAAGHASRRETIATLLARAAYARGGVNWRDAIPYYQHVLALEPDDVTANLAMVELYEEAGLRDTALARLQAALVQRPRSVSLLRATVAALRDEGRETEADEVAERYAALRFDDPAFARARIDLAVARRDEASAARWIDRLVATNPDSSGALEMAAQAWSRLGERARAIAAYRGALDLAPEDTDTMRQLAAVYSIAGQRDEQLHLLKRVLELMPQAKDVRDEVAHIEPAAPRPDEQYARPSQDFLAMRSRAGEWPVAPDAGRPAGDDGLPERPREPVPPGRLPAAHRGRRGDVARVRVLVRERQPGRRAPRRARVPQQRARRRGGRERRGRHGGRSGGLDVHERAQLLRALPAARAGRRRRAAVSRGGRGAAQRVRRLLRRARVHAELRVDRPERVRADDAQGAHVLLQRAAGAGSRAFRRGARRPAHLHVPRAERPGHGAGGRCSHPGPRSSGT